MHNKISSLVSTMDATSGTDSISLDAIEAQYKVKLPEQYRDFMLYTNGAEGFVGGNRNSYLRVLPIEKVPLANQAYEGNEDAQFLLIFASNGGGEAYAFDKRFGHLPCVNVPFGDMSLEQVTPCGSDFVEFLKYLAQNE